MSYFETIDTQQKAYFVGFIAGDGYIRHSPEHHKYHVSLHLHLKDRIVLETLKAEANIRANIYDQIRLTSRGTMSYSGKLEYSGKDVVADLGKYNLYPKKSFTLPAFLYTLGEFDLEGLLGLSDADGSFFVRTGEKRPGWNLRATMSVIEEVIELLGVTKFRINHDHPYVPQLNVTRVDQVETVYHLLYDTPPPFFLERKWLVPTKYFEPDKIIACQTKQLSLQEALSSSKCSLSKLEQSSTLLEPSTSVESTILSPFC